MRGRSRVMQRPEREDVYAAWIKVQDLEEALAKAKVDHQRLADARYGHDAEQPRRVKQALHSVQGPPLLHF